VRSALSETRATLARGEAAHRRPPDDAAFRVLEEKIVQLNTSGEAAAAEESRAALWSLQKAMDARAAQLAKLDRERKFNADDMCRVTAEKSLVGRRAVPLRRHCKRLPACRRGANSRRPLSAACTPDTVKELPYEEYVAKHKARRRRERLARAADGGKQALLDDYASRVRSNDENVDFMEAHPEVLHEHAMGYLLMEALQLGMAGKTVRARRSGGS